MGITEKSSPFSPCIPLTSQVEFAWSGLHGSSLALAIVNAAAQHQGLTVVTASSTQQAHELENDLAIFNQSSKLPVIHFADWETLPYDAFSPHADIISQRLEALNRLPKIKQGILVVPAATLMQRLLPKDHLVAHSLLLSKGDAIDIDAFRRSLEAAGYYCVSQVHEPGEFAVRGSLIDLFPMGSNLPFRIELFDEDVDSIRSFDPDNQLSLEKLNSIQLLPAREFPFDDDARAKFRSRFREEFSVDTHRCPLYQDVRNNIAGAGLEYYLPLFFDETSSLFDYFGKHPLFIVTPDAKSAAENFWIHTASRYEQLRHDVERPLLSPSKLYLTPDEVNDELHLAPRISIIGKGQRRHASAKPFVFSVSPPIDLPLHEKGAEPAAKLKEELLNTKQRIIITADSAGRREHILDSLSLFEINVSHQKNWQTCLSNSEKLSITVAPLSTGFKLPDPPILILTESQLFGHRIQQRRRRHKASREPEAIIKDLTDLHIGEPVVHEEHGIGRYMGLQTLKVGKDLQEFLSIAYKGDDKLFVPVAALGLVGRYTGGSAETAPLHKLGSDRWSKAKQKAAEKVRDVAAELLEIYSQREASDGHSFNYDKQLYEEFAASFPFEETVDQQICIDNVLADLSSPKIMDRVVCGDVGFGKTEVALRAAFATVTSGKQVAILVPTTLLAQQHYQNFCDRLADWPIHTAVISRFQSSKESKETIKNVASGHVDILIGTHKLLQSDMSFSDIGLVIIDEEQRFGVRQKEQLKKFRSEVNFLTLTATPIPRTLNMALSGMRDLSIIATPPANRIAVKTLITRWENGMLKEAIQRELQRGGQVYFLHNDVSSIERIADDIRQLLPEARVKIGHGQMPERELEQVMLDFYRQRFNILVCTTIIESGIDIPNANTIIMNRADKLGLAQLHQLRGRVGRSHHRAYAYLIVPDKRAMSRDAKKRIEAISSLKELGAGFTLATHDMEIRGAGALLGEDQSGQMHEIGFSLYTDLLKRAVDALKSGSQVDLTSPLSKGTEVELHLPALIPDDYLADVHTRLILYKRIASARNDDELKELKIEMIDRFGLLPDPTKNLFDINKIRLRTENMGIIKLELGEKSGRILFNEKPNIDSLALIKLVQSEPQHYAIDGQTKIKIQQNLEKPQARIDAALSLVKRLTLKQTT